MAVVNDVIIKLDILNHFIMQSVPRKPYIKQKNDGYEAIGTPRHKPNAKAIDIEILKKHVTGHHTIGVYGGKLVDFICFDVDTGRNGIKIAQNDVIKVINKLVDYGLNRNEIFTEFSGKKGYHVYLFLSESIDVDLIEKLHKRLLYDLSDDKQTYTNKDIEVRPLINKGLKLPFGIHKATGNHSNFVNVEDDFKIIKLIELQKKLKRINAIAFFDGLQLDSDDLFTLEIPKTQETNTLIASSDMTENYIDVRLDNLEKILSENRLLDSGTRHNVTRHLATYLRLKNYDKPTVKQIITNVMLNTKRNYPLLINKSTSETFIISEINRLVERDFIKKPTFYRKSRDIELYKEELEEILKVKGWEKKKILFAVLIHAKRYAIKDGTFYMTYQYLIDFGCVKNRSRLKKYLVELEQEGYIKIVASNVINIAKTQYDNYENEKVKFKQPNIYRLEKGIKKSFGKHSAKVIIKAEEQAQLSEQLLKLCAPSELKGNLTRREYEKVIS